MESFTLMRNSFECDQEVLYRAYASHSNSYFSRSDVSVEAENSSHSLKKNKKKYGTFNGWKLPGKPIRAYNIKPILDHINIIIIILDLNKKSIKHAAKWIEKDMWN